MSSFPWKNGIWFNKELFYMSRVDGDKVEIVNKIALDSDLIEPDFVDTWKTGDFGDANEEVAKASGIQKNNWKTESMIAPVSGVLSEDGTKIYTFGLTNKLEIWEWQTPEQIEEFKKTREHFKELSCPFYTAEPEKPGKIIWFSGLPGAGKSTTAQLLAKKSGYRYYEADCMNWFLNPFIDPSIENPTIQAMKQNPLMVTSFFSFLFFKTQYGMFMLGWLLL